MTGRYPSRRELLIAAAAIGATFPYAMAGEAERGLRELARRCGVDFGCAMRKVDVDSRPEWGEMMRREAGIITPEYELKWNALSKKPGVYDFRAADWFIEFAKRNSQAVRGHTLVWDQALPDWFPKAQSSADAETLMLDHIASVAGHLAGKVVAWDVVNEAIDETGYKETPWFSALGGKYVRRAFEAAAQADPKAKLYYNDYDLEYDTPEQDSRRANVLDMLSVLKDAGAPIHGLGIQGHIQPGRWPFDPDKFAKFLADVAALDIDIAITELDVSDRALPTSITERDNAVAEATSALLRVALQQQRTVAIQTWGFADWHTWLNDLADRKRSDGMPQRPLPLDADGRPKPMRKALATAFDQAARTRNR